MTARENQYPPAKQVHIGDVLCNITKDKDDFVVTIAEGQKLFPEWIVRGAATEAHAISTAERVIEARRAGYSFARVYDWASCQEVKSMSQRRRKNPRR